MVKQESLEETYEYSEAPIQEEFIFDPDVDPGAVIEFLDALELFDNNAKLSRGNIRTIGEAVVKFSGAVRPKK